MAISCYAEAPGAAWYEPCSPPASTMGSARGRACLTREIIGTVKVVIIEERQYGAWRGQPGGAHEAASRSQAMLSITAAGFQTSLARLRLAARASHRVDHLIRAAIRQSRRPSRAARSRRSTGACSSKWRLAWCRRLAHQRSRIPARPRSHQAPPSTRSRHVAHKQAAGPKTSFSRSSRVIGILRDVHGIAARPFVCAATAS